MTACLVCFNLVAPLLVAQAELPPRPSGCASEADCPGGRICADGKCWPRCTDDAGCGDLTACMEGACRPVPHVAWFRRQAEEAAARAVAGVPRSATQYVPPTAVAAIAVGVNLMLGGAATWLYMVFLITSQSPIQMTTTLLVAGLVEFGVGGALFAFGASRLNP